MATCTNLALCEPESLVFSVFKVGEESTSEVDINMTSSNLKFENFRLSKQYYMPSREKNGKMDE